MKDIRAAIAGLGHMGSLHMMSCLHIDDVNVVAVADKSNRSLRRAGALGIENLYRDYNEMISGSSDLDIDAVIISLPNFLHCKSAAASLKAGLHTFVEKPIATNVEESREVARLAGRSQGIFTIGNALRFLEAVEKMKEIVDSGRIGRIEMITIESIQNGPLTHGVVPKDVPTWWFDPEKSGGGVLLDLGYHLIDLFRLFAGEPKVIFAKLDHKYHLPVEDSATVLLDSKGVRGVINVGWFEKAIFPRFNFRIILHGNADYISSEELVPRNLYFHAAKEGTKNLLRRIVGKKIKPLAYTYYYESYYKELKHFFNCIRERSQPLVSAEDGLRTMAIIEEIYRLSSSSG